MITEESGQIIVDDVTGKLIDAAEKYAEIYSDDERQDIKTDVLNAFYHGANYQKKCQHNQIIVDELRPMSDARNLGVKRCLAVFVGYPDCFHIVEQYADTYWSDGEDDWHRDDEFIGWVPCPIYRPKDGA